MTIIIQVDRLLKTYGDFKAVNEISFNVQKGEIFGFLGPNGAGKTTTIKMLTTLTRPTAGKVTLDGHDPAVNPNEARHSFGIVFQDQSLDDELTAWENMEYHGMLYAVPKPLRHQRIEELLKFVELWDRKNDFVKTFSGGMKRRLEIARGLLHHPTILFLDEPTLGLDPQTRNHIWNYVCRLSKEEGMTIFFTTHYMQEAEDNADRIAIMDHGVIVAQDTVEKLMQNTQTENLEAAFLKLTGNELREENSNHTDNMRMRRRAWTGRR